MITNNSDNITNKAQNGTQKHKSTNTKIQYLKKEQNRTREKTQKSVQPCSIMYNENTISEVFN